MSDEASSQNTDYDDKNNSTSTNFDVTEIISKFELNNNKERMDQMERSIILFLSTDENVRKLGVDPELMGKELKELIFGDDIGYFSTDINQNELNAKKELENSNINEDSIDEDDDDDDDDEDDDEVNWVTNVERRQAELEKLREENRALKEDVAKLNLEIANLRKLGDPTKVLLEFAEELFSDEENPEHLEARVEFVEKLTEIITSFMNSTVTEKNDEEFNSTGQCPVLEASY